MRIAIRICIKRKWEKLLTFKQTKQNNRSTLSRTDFKYHGSEGYYEYSRSDAPSAT